MKKIIFWFLCLILWFSLFTVNVEARSYRTSSSDVYVHGYTKKNWTYVAPYYRTPPNSTKLDNYSCIDNWVCWWGKSTYTTPTSTYTTPTSTYTTPTSTYTTPTYIILDQKCNQEYPGTIYRKSDWRCACSWDIIWTSRRNPRTQNCYLESNETLLKESQYVYFTSNDKNAVDQKCKEIYWIHWVINQVWWAPYSERNCDCEKWYYRNDKKICVKAEVACREEAWINYFFYYSDDGISGRCGCKTGYDFNWYAPMWAPNKCLSWNILCQIKYGDNAYNDQTISSDSSCYCRSGYVSLPDSKSLTKISCQKKN